MESEPANTTASAPTNSAKPRSHIKLIAVVAVAAILLVVGCLLVSSMLTKPPGQYAWLFKGAYAMYEGSTSMSVTGFDVSVSFAV
ncbi:hypothetical protein G4O51_09785 [Candidatus Bathyarchaeota archaeon A05DMB-2]|nr:hypothetical protein [Candidatus Bathyarchaeota archaeon A05DMB-2]